ncbi:MAG: hypothetical protein ABIQ93_02850 [Saprospiraceae bacterium]
MKTQQSAPFPGPVAGKFYLLALCLLAACFCQAQSKATINTVFYITIPPEFEQCGLGNVRLLVEGIDANNSQFWQSFPYTPGETTLIMKNIGEFRVTLTGLECPAVDIYLVDENGTATKSEAINLRPSARLRCYGGRFHVTLR